MSLGRLQHTRRSECGANGLLTNAAKQAGSKHHALDDWLANMPIKQHATHAATLAGRASAVLTWMHRLLVGDVVAYPRKVPPVLGR